MSKIILRTVGAAALLALGSATFTGTALAGGKGGGDDHTATAVGCSAKNSQDGNLIPVNVLGDLLNGNNILSNCPATATAN
jgi:hypothetical protein